jgi:prepilin-type processing-associated H-X9-DG protein
LELLAVIAILAILAGLLVPVFVRARERAHRTRCLAHLRGIGQAYRLYLQDWEEQFPPWSFAARPVVHSGQFPFVAWPPMEDRRSSCWTEYLQSYLPSTRQHLDPGAEATRARSGRGWRADYAMFTSGPGGIGTAAAPYWRWPVPGASLASVTRPGETIVLIEGISTIDTAWLETGRHGGGVNAAFLDGHAGWLPPRELERVDTDGRGFHWLRYATIDR